jgi:hypothetical protein
MVSRLTLKFKDYMYVELIRKLRKGKLRAQRRKIDEYCVIEIISKTSLYCKIQWVEQLFSYLLEPQTQNSFFT